MTRKRPVGKKARFRVKQIVSIRNTFGFGQIAERKLFEHGFSYHLFPVMEHHASGWYDEGDLRPLNSCERGSRRGDRPSRRGLAKLEADNAALREALRWSIEEVEARDVCMITEEPERTDKIKEARALLGAKP